MRLLPSCNVKLREAPNAFERMRRGGGWNTAEGRREPQKNLERHHLGFWGLQPLEIPQNGQSFVWKSLRKSLGGRLCSAAFTPARRADLGNRGTAPAVIGDLGRGSTPAMLLPVRKFSVLQSLENTQNRERISI